MRKFLFILMLMGIVYHASAQVAEYTFSQATNTYNEISGGTVLGSATTNDEYIVDPAVPGGSTTVTSGVGLPIGFTLAFNGGNYDVFGVHANGWISLGQSSQSPSVNMNTSSNITPISATSTAPASLQNRVVGFGRNLIAQAVSELRYETIGSVPNRALVVQWKNYKRTTGGAVDTLNFQIRLNETSNVIEVVYGKMIASSSSNNIQVGLRGQSNTDFNNRTVTTDWSVSTAGTLNTSTVTISSTVFPVQGLTYIWSPPLANDAGVILISSPATTIPSGTQDIAVTIKNFGTDTLNNANIAWSVNGANQTSHAWSGLLPHDSIYGPDTIGTFNFTLSGNNIIKAWTVNPNGIIDGNNVNDTTSLIVYVLPANDMSTVAWITPVGGCGLTGSETVTVKITNAGTNPQSNIPVRYSIDGGATIIGPEYVAGPVNPGDTVSYTFTTTADFSVPGTYHCISQVQLTGDQNHPNDTASYFIISTGTIHTFPFTENFNNPAGTPYFSLSAAANAGVNFLDTNGVNNTGCAFLTGFINNTGWSGTGTISAAAAYGTYTSHHATLAPFCNIDATGLTTLRMNFDLRQVYYTQRTYTWLVLIANGTDTLTDINGIKYYNPVTISSDPFTTRIFDLAAYAGTSFTLEFKSACKYNAAAGAPGNNNYIDNIIFYVPTANDAGVISVISPISAPCGNANDSLVVIVKNFGLDTLTNIPVIGDITAPSGGHLILNNTLAGPLAPNASDTLVVGYGNTLPSGIYNVAAYTDLASDTVFINDTTNYAFNIYSPLAIPHLEDFESSTPLANWNTNFITGNGHGNTSYVMYRNLSTTNTTGTATINKRVGPIHSDSYLSFIYRIVNVTGGGATTLGTDSVFIMLSDDCQATFDTVYTINQTTHTPSTSMKRVVIPIGTYNTGKLILEIFAKRGTTGNYYLDIDEIAFSDAPVVDLGPDTAFCPGSNITLDAGNPPPGYYYLYLWTTALNPSPFANVQVITVDSAATYIAYVDNGFGVTDIDTVVVGYHPIPVVSLGNDTTNCGSVTLDSGTGYDLYNWSTGETSQTITVTSTDTYWVDVTNTSGCTSRDSIDVTIIPLPTVDAGPTQTICYIDTLYIISAAAADYDSLLWTSNGDGHFEDSTLLNPYYIPGTTDITNGAVDLTLTAYANCDTVNSLIVVTITTSAVAYAGSDEEICLGDIVQLSATGGTSYVWSPATNLSDPNIPNPIASPSSTTTYTVLVSSSCGTATDDVVITVDNIIAPDLGTDTVLCADMSVTLDAGTGYDSYNWSTGEPTQTITIDTTGIGLGTFNFWVEVTSGVCSVSDNINVTFTSCVSTVDYSGNSDISIYPNPTTGMTNIVINGFSNAVLSIYNMQGAVVYTESINTDNSSVTKQLDLSYLPKGVYLVRLNNYKNNVTDRLIIQ